MTCWALVLAQMLCLATSHPTSAVSDAPRYRLDELAESLEGTAGSRYHLDDLAESLERASATRYRLIDLAEALQRAAVPRYRLVDLAESLDVERCICMTTRLSPLTLRSEVLLVTDCECGP